MKTARFITTLLALTACSAAAEIKRSSRNLESLSKRSTDNSAASRSGNSGMAVGSPKQEPAQNVVTKVSFVGPKSGWGFVQQTSPFYSPEGKNLGTLPGGTLFRYTDVKSSSRNAVLVSTVKHGEAWEGPCLIDCTDVAVYEGAPDAVDPATVKKLSEYFTLKGKVEDRKDALADEAAAANPYYQTAKQAQQAYVDSIAKAADMEKKMSAMTGARKAKADDELRAFKYEQVRIKAKADQATAAYKAWKAAHPIDPARLAADPQLKALEAALQEAASPVKNLLPPAS